MTVDEPVVFLNGDWLPLSEAKIPVLDRGFIFGDAVYEVIPVYARQPLRLDGHLHRLARSLQAIRIGNPFDDAGWRSLVAEAIARNDPDDQSVYIHVTRGAARRDPALPAGLVPTVLVIANPSAAPSRQLIDEGVDCVTAPDNRWGRCDIKSTALLANCLLRQVSADAGACETLLLRDAHLTEGSSSNVFVVNDGRVATPPRTPEILAGITLDLVVDLARAVGIAVELRPVGEAELRAGDEIWISSASKEVLAVRRLDGIAVGRGAAAGRPGPVYRQVRKAFDEAILELRRPRGGP